MTEEELLNANQVAALLGFHTRTAREILKKSCKALGKAKSNHITVNEFCYLHRLLEEETRKALKLIKLGFSR
jgi:predicted nucleic acid-binding protein